MRFLINTFRTQRFFIEKKCSLSTLSGFLLMQMHCPWKFFILFYKFKWKFDVGLWHLSLTVTPSQSLSTLAKLQRVGLLNILPRAEETKEIEPSKIWESSGYHEEVSYFTGSVLFFSCFSLRCTGRRGEGSPHRDQWSWRDYFSCASGMVSWFLGLHKAVIILT